MTTTRRDATVIAAHRTAVWARRLLGILFCAACSSPARDLDAAVRDKYDVGDFIRVVTQSRGGGSSVTVEAAAMSFTRDDGTVTLVATVHLADESFFKSLDVHIRDATRIWAEGLEEPGTSATAGELPAPLAKLRQYYDLLSALGNLQNQKEWELRVLDRRWRRADISLEEAREAVVGDSPEWAAFERSVDAALRRLESFGQGGPKAAVRQARLEVVRSIRATLEDTARGTPNQFGAQRESAAWTAIVEGASDAGANQTILFGAAHAPTIADELCHLGYVPSSTCWHVVLEVEDETAGTGAAEDRVKGGQETPAEDPEDDL